MDTIKELLFTQFASQYKLMCDTIKKLPIPNPSVVLLILWQFDLAFLAVKEQFLVMDFTPPATPPQQPEEPKVEVVVDAAENAA